MKTIKFILSVILMMMAICAQAQTVQVMKDGKVIKEYPASEVKSVEVKPVYYYYAGWECPANEDDLKRLAVSPNGACIGTKLGTYSSASPLRNYCADKCIDESLESDGEVYIVVPTGIGIYDGINTPLYTNTNIMEKLTSTINNHDIYKTKLKYWDIDWCVLY